MNAVLQVNSCKAFSKYPEASCLARVIPSLRFRWMSDGLENDMPVSMLEVKIRYKGPKGLSRIS